MVKVGYTGFILLIKAVTFTKESTFLIFDHLSLWQRILKDPVFALLNREIIEALTQPLYHDNQYAIHATTFERIPLSKTVNAADF